MRVRIFKKNEKGEHRYFRTMTFETDVFEAQADNIVASAAMGVDDIVLVNDFYMLLTGRHPAFWQTLLATDPRVQGLYTHAVECERNQARDRMMGVEW